MGVAFRTQTEEDVAWGPLVDVSQEGVEDVAFDLDVEGFLPLVEDEDDGAFGDVVDDGEEFVGLLALQAGWGLEATAEQIVVGGGEGVEAFLDEVAYVFERRSGGECLEEGAYCFSGLRDAIFFSWSQVILA